MKTVFRILVAFVVSLSAALANAATIDRMFTATFGHYSQTYAPGQPFMLFSQADYYLLSDGTSWSSGAGWHPDSFGELKRVETSGDTVRYVFSRPADRILFQNTDYDSGDHSAQGQLGSPKELVLVAKLGGKRGVIQGYTRILSNDETWYGEPRFNYYSASVGENVFFRQKFVLSDTTFTSDLFDREFTYNVTGFVDFLRKR